MPRSKLLKPLLVSVTLLAANAPTFAAGGHGGGGGGHGGGGGGHASAGAGGGHASAGGGAHYSGGGASHYSGGASSGGVRYAGGQSYGGTAVGRSGSYATPQHSAAPQHFAAPQHSAAPQQHFAAPQQHSAASAGVMRPVGPQGGGGHVAPTGLATHQPYNLSQSAPRSAGFAQGTAQGFTPAAGYHANGGGNSPAYRPYSSANVGAGSGPSTNFGLPSGNRTVVTNNSYGNNAGFRYGLGSQAYGGGGFVRPVGYGGYGSPYGYGGYRGYGGYGGYFSPYGFGLSVGFGSPFGFGFGGFGSPYGYGGYGGYGYGGYGYGGLGFGGFNRYGGGYGGGYGGFNGVGYSGSYASPIYVAPPVAVLSDFVPVAPAPVIDQSVIPPASDLLPAPAPVLAPVGFAAQADQFVRDGKFEEAARAYRHATVDEPQNGALAVRASQALTAAGKYDEAAGAAQQGFALIDPKDWLTEAKNSGNVFGNPRAATAAYDTLVKASADAKAGPGVKFLSGIAAAGRGDFARSSADFDAVTKLVPQDTVAAQWKTIVDEKK